MFGSLISGKFSNKCKHSVKCIKCRMETIRKKKQAMVRYLKKDVADLIASGHDANAYGRMDALIVEINKSLCYDMIEQYCCCILQHLSTMQKDRVCPEATTEAVATLIFAAARFSDLPELTDLRRHFTERYGTNMEAYINEEFIEKMQKKSFSKDKKLQLMQYIAQDFSIHWDVKEFEYKLSNPSAPTHPKIHFSTNNENNQKPHIFHGKREETDGPNKELNNAGKQVNSEVIKEDRKIIQMERYAHRSRTSVQKEEAVDELKNVKPPPFDKRVAVNVLPNENQNGNYVKDRNYEGNNTRRLSGSVCEEIGSVGIAGQDAPPVNAGKTKAVNIPPPYTKFSGDMNGTSTNHDDSAHSTAYNVQGSRLNRRVNPENNRPFNPNPPYVKPMVPRSPTETGYLEPINGGAVDAAVHVKNVPFSVRRRRSDNATAAVSETTVDDRQISISHLPERMKEDAIDRRMHRTFTDQPRHGEKCDEEEMMGDPLMYYSSKKGRARMRGPDPILVAEPANPVETMIRRPVRVYSTQDQLSSYRQRMPSGLPGHDELAARLAALKKI